VIAVIQCASQKRPDAGFLKTSDGRLVLFVANPQIAPPRDDLVYACPDDNTGGGETWREMLLRYNEAPGNNPLHLLPAYELYGNPTYRRLVDRVGLSNVFILSAGWGFDKCALLDAVV